MCLFVMDRDLGLVVASCIWFTVCFEFWLFVGLLICLLALCLICACCFACGLVCCIWLLVRVFAFGVVFVCVCVGVV